MVLVIAVQTEYNTAVLGMEYRVTSRETIRSLSEYSFERGGWLNQRGSSRDE